MNIQDVAAEAGVSVATVSRAFNLPGKVTPATRELVEQAARAVGYLPNASARTLRTQRSHVLGVVLPTLLNPVFAECLDGIARAATAANYAIQSITTEYSLDLEELAVNQLITHNVDGMILVIGNPATSKVLKRLGAISLPYVLAYNRHPDHPCVSVDSEKAVTELVLRLTSLGHRQITMVSGQLAVSDRAQQRCRGFLQGMEANGLKDVAKILEVPFVNTAVKEISALLQRQPRPTALICSNDLLAVRCIRAAHLAGLVVPRDVSVLGFDGIALGEDLTPMLSTITQPNAEIGSSSVELLVNAMAAGTALTADDSRTLAYAFRIGESCAATSSPATSTTSKKT